MKDSNNNNMNHKSRGQNNKVNNKNSQDNKHVCVVKSSFKKE